MPNCYDRKGNLYDETDKLVEPAQETVDDDSFYCVTCKKFVKRHTGIFASRDLGGWFCAEHRTMFNADLSQYNHPVSS